MPYQFYRKMLFGLILIILAIKVVSQSTSPKLVTINPQSTTKGDLKLSDVVESIKYIPLETRNNCLIGNVTYFDVSQNYIIVYCSQAKNFYLFRKNGTFIRKISRLGQGPSEYIEPSAIYLDELKKNIIICDFNKMLYFSLDGAFLNYKSIDLNQEMYLGYANERFVTGTPSGVFIDSTFYVYKILDSQGKVIKKAKKSIPLYVGGNKEHKVAFVSFGPPIHYYKFDGKIHVKEAVLNDTVYEVSLNNLFLPKYVIKAGKYSVTPEIKSDLKRYFDLARSYVVPLSVFEARNYLFLSYQYKEIKYYCYYDKTTKTLNYFDSKQGIPNDYNGGFDFWPYHISGQSNNEFYTFYNADKFSDQPQQKKYAPKGSPASIKQVKDLFQKMDPEANPVLVITKMK